MKVRNLFILAVIALTAVSCCPCRTRSARAALTDRQWQLIQIEGSALAATADNFTLAFEGERVSGRGACNSLTGTFSRSASGALMLSEMTSTRMLCPDQGDEDRFTRLLARVDGYSVDGPLLMLSSGGTVTMIFQERK